MRHSPSESPGDRGHPRHRPRRKPRHGRRAHIYAALDLGTNNCRLLIARSEGQGFRVIDAFSRIVQLGEGVHHSGRLSEEAMDRAILALSVCADKMVRRHVTRVRAIATEACRQAANGVYFIERVRRETGVELDIITPEEEARLAVAGCAPLFTPEHDHLAVFDIGGGSTEIAWFDLQSLPPSARREILTRCAVRGAGGSRPTHWTSLPTGVVSLAERFVHMTDERARFAAMTGFVQGLIDPFAAKAQPLNGAPARIQLLGASGTVTTLAGIHLELERYSRQDVDGVWIDVAALDTVTDNLLGMTMRQRAAIPCVGADRSEFVMSGAAILRAITSSWQAPAVRVADRGLREGVLYGLMLREDARARRGGDRRPRVPHYTRAAE